MISRSNQGLISVGISQMTTNEHNKACSTAEQHIWVYLLNWTKILVYNNLMLYPQKVVLLQNWTREHILTKYCTWITTIVPTAVATCAALGDGGSPKGVSLNMKNKYFHFYISFILNAVLILILLCLFGAKQHSRTFQGIIEI